MTTVWKHEGLRMIEFFSGIGGMRLAVESVLAHTQRNNNCKSLSYCQAFDISLHANRCYQHNFETSDERMTAATVSTKLVEQLKSRDLDGKAELWTMSPPCQPFTDTRGAKGLDMEDKRCNGLKAIMTLLTEINDKPNWILLENVKGFANSAMVVQWKACLRENGYTWKDYLVSPIQLGIPNHRQRYYILCERSDRWKDRGDDLMPETALDVTARGDEIQKHVVAEYLDMITDEQVQQSVVPDSILQKGWAPRQIGIVSTRDTATHCFTAGYGRIYHQSTGSVLLMPRKDEEQVALAEQALDRTDMMKYSGRLRRFTPNELLSLFGFPDSYTFPDDLSWGQQYKLIGNSVNVTVVTELVAELLRGAISTNFTSTEDKLSVGGTKGHMEETIDGNLRSLYEAYRWKMIPNCTGRHTCREHQLVSTMGPLDMLNRVGISKMETGASLQLFRFELPGRPDPVLVVPLDSRQNTGVITFEKAEPSSFVHTLNAPSGFRRKLQAIGIMVSDDDICLASEHVTGSPESESPDQEIVG